MVAAPTTFKTEGDASRWLSTTEADLARGTFLDPQAGKITVDASREGLTVKWRSARLHGVR